MQKLKFLFGTHNHQPVGNFEHVMVEAYHRAYLPFLEVMAAHPRIKFSVHYSGILYDWIKERHPEFLDLLNRLVKRGQVEILSGGYYEPVLTVIPDEDKLGQIEMSNRFIKENFWKAARGIWLTERVWEPTLPKVLAQAGVEYVLVDDDHLLQAGVAPERLTGYYITEEAGETIKLFPISRNLRQAIPHKSPEEIIKYLKSIPNPDGAATAVFMDDGEDFGLRPNTHRWIYGEGYLDRLLGLLEENSDWIEFTNFSDYLDEYPAQGRIYVPASSYFEMMEWASLEGAVGEDGSGHFRNFFVKYPEANNMHKKMLYVSRRLQTLSRGRSLIGGHRRNEELKKAREDLYKGQCNCAYWRGMFGGLSLPHLRHAVYSHLIRAETELEKISRGGKTHVDLAVMDFDKDGQDEVILSNNLLNLYFSPARGGSLFELDYKPRAFNLVDTLDTGQPSRGCLLDHFLDRRADLENFSGREAGDFVKGKYSFMPRRKEAEIGLRLSREGRVEGASVRVEKSISLFPRQSIFTVEYEISNLGEEPDELWFGVEFNLSLLAGNSPDRYYIIDDHNLADNSLQSRGETERTGLVKLIDEWSGFAVSLEMSRPALLWRFPVENDCGYQSSVVLPSWKFGLGPQETWFVKISFRVEE